MFVRHRLTRAGTACVMAGLFLAAIFLSTGLRSASAAKPAPRITNFCPLHLYVAKAKVAPGGPNVYVLALRTDGAWGMSSGTVRLYSGDRRFDVPYVNRRAIGADDTTIGPESRFAVELPPGAAVDGAYVSQMLVPEPFDCPLGFVWPRDTQANPGLPEIALNLAIEKPVAAGPAVLDPAPSCPVPDRDADADPELESNELKEIVHSEGVSGVTTLRVLVLPDGSAGEAIVTASSGNAVLDQAVKVAVLTSKYRPALWHCRPVMSRFNYQITFHPR